MSSSPFPSHSSLCIDKDHPIWFTKELKALLLPPDTFRVLFLHFCKSAWEHLQGGSCLVWLLLLPRVLLLSEVEREKAHQKGQVWVHHHQNSQWPQQHNQYQQRQHHHKSAQVCLASNYELRVTEIYSPKNREEEKKKKKNSSSLDLLRGITFLLRILEGWIGLSRRAGESRGAKISRPRRHSIKCEGSGTSSSSLWTKTSGFRPWSILVCQRIWTLRNLRTTSNGEAIWADCNLEISVLLQLEEGCRQMGLETGSQYLSCENRWKMQACSGAGRMEKGGDM